MANSEVELYSGVDTADVPSAEWGWSKITYRTWYALGIFVVVLLLAMTHGNHVGRVEDWFLLAFAGATALVILRDWIMRRRGMLR